MREQEILLDGPIDPGQHVVGVIGGIFLGFGLGHIAQGRFLERGYLFMLGEAAALVLAISALASCIDDSNCNEGLFWLGFGGLGVLRIWEVGDLIVAPSTHNNRYWRVRAKVDGAPRWGALVAPTASGGGIAGFAVRF
jgi:hypothetical protein